MTLKATHSKSFNYFLGAQRQRTSTSIFIEAVESVSQSTSQVFEDVLIDMFRVDRRVQTLNTPARHEDRHEVLRINNDVCKSR